MNCPIGYGLGACPACIYSKEFFCDYLFVIGQPGETGKPKVRSLLGERRVNYTWVCGICGRFIEGKSNTIHLAIGSHILAEYNQGKRKHPYSSQADNDTGKKHI